MHPEPRKIPCSPVGLKNQRTKFSIATDAAKSKRKSDIKTATKVVPQILDIPST